MGDGLTTNGETGRRARRLPSVLLGVGIVVALVATVLLTTGSTNPAIALAPNGHWVFNRSEGSVVHVDGGTDKVDARVAVPDAPREPGLTLQSPTQGFLVGRRSVTVFGKSTLTVESTIPTGQDEMPVGIEVTGGPYLVYRQAGTIVRLGTRPTSIPIGGPVERPVYTDDGTVWLHRPDNGTLCALRAGAETLDCAVQTDPGPSGSLTVTGDRASFLSTARDAVEPITDGSLGSAVPVGTDVGTDALVADRDTRGRLPELEPATTRMLLLDTAGVAQSRVGGGPVPVQLPAGTYTSPVTSDGVVAVVEQTRNHLLTFSVDGRQLADVALPPGEAAQITRGADGRIYVDDADGAGTHLVQPDGTVTSVRTGAAPDAVQAAGADRASLVTPPPPRSRGSGSAQSSGRGGDAGSIGSGGIPVPVPGGTPERVRGTAPIQPQPQPPQPPQPAVDLPPVPSQLTGVANPDGTLDVSWVEAPASNITYEVRVNGRRANFRFTEGAAAKITGLTPGVPVTITVVSVGPSGSSAPSNAITLTPVGAAEVGAPGGFSGERRNLSGSTMVTLNWTAPTLNGARLVGYEVSGTGIAPFTTTVTGTTYQDDGNYCAQSIRYQVRAITEPASGGAQTKGEQATTTVSSPVDCTLPLILDSAEATGPTVVTVILHCEGSGRGGASTANVRLFFNGARSWTGTCDVNAGPTSVTARVTGLAPGTEYTVTGTSSSDSGSKPGTNTLTVTTPAQ